MKRLFTFGCSFTQYNWPTWADILGCEFDYFENWGRRGGGNQYIFNSIIECLVKNKLNKNDTIIVMWTNVTREDRYLKGKWVTPGNIFTQNTYDEKFVKSFADIKGYYLRDLASIHAIKKTLEAYNVSYIFTSMVPIANSDQYHLTEEMPQLVEQFDAYKETLSTIRPSIFESIFNYDWSSRPLFSNIPEFESYYYGVAGRDWPDAKTFIDCFYKQNFNTINPNIREELLDKKWGWKNRLLFAIRSDPHPTPAEHLEFIDKVLLDFNISNKTRIWVNEITQRVINQTEYDDLWDNKQLAKRW
jgi:hypothetical protein